jgi:hypothetical protein
VGPPELANADPANTPINIKNITDSFFMFPLSVSAVHIVDPRLSESVAFYQFWTAEA